MTEAAPARNCDEFLCKQCGQWIVSLPPQEPPPTSCATCAWLDEFIGDPAEREALRRRYCGSAG